ncbi:MAG TPA: hypothetical protein VGI61_08350 [Parafilimonas sp.]|jgi:hypothetical protein
MIQNLQRIKIRHTVVGRAALNSFSKAQWQNLAEGLVDRKK